jgi:hypothetical protein
MTRRRIRAYALVIAVCLWAIWIVDVSTAGVADRFGKVKGTDFLQFYVAGSFVRDGRTDLLYDLRAQYARARALAPGARDTLYFPIQSPQTALAFAPLTAFSYGIAAAIWFLVIVLLYAGACWRTWRSCASLHKYRYEAAACAVAFPGLYSTVLHGQTSCVALVAVVGALLALRRDRRYLAGLALGCLVFKPHWILAAGAVFVIAREWRVTAGVLSGAVVQIGVAWLLVGRAVMSAYWTALWSVQRLGDLLEPRAGNTIKSFFAVFVPFKTLALALYAIAAIATLLVAAKVWRTHTRFEIRASAIVLAIVLISPHAFEYDLILLAPVFLLLANWLTESAGAPWTRTISWGLCALFPAPLLLALPAPIRLQFSVTAMAVVLFGLRQLTQYSSDATAEGAAGLSVRTIQFESR